MFKKIALIGITVGSLFSFFVSFAETPNGDCENCTPEQQLQSTQSCDALTLKSAVLVQVSAVEQELKESNTVKKENLISLTDSLNVLRECEKTKQINLTSCLLANVETQTLLADDIALINRVSTYEAGGKCNVPRSSGILSEVKKLSTNFQIASSPGGVNWQVHGPRFDCDAGDYGSSLRTFVISNGHGSKDAAIQFADWPEALVLPYKVVVTRKKSETEAWFEFEVKPDAIGGMKDFLGAKPVTPGEVIRAPANSGIVTINFTKGGVFKFNTDTVKFGSRKQWVRYGDEANDDESLLHAVPKSTKGDGPQYVKEYELSYHSYKNSQTHAKRINFKTSNVKMNTPKVVDDNVRFEFTNGAHIDFNPTDGKFAGSNFMDASMFDEEKCKTNNNGKHYKYIKFTPKIKTVPGQNFTGSISTVRG